MVLPFPNRKRNFFVALLSFLFLIKLIFLAWLWIYVEKSGGKVELAYLVLVFPAACLVAFSGFCLWRLFLRLKIKEFTQMD